MTDLANAGSPATELSLRDTIAASLEKHSAPETPVAPAPEAAPAPQETQAEAEARARDEKGRFAAKAAEAAETAPKPAPEAKETSEQPVEAKEAAPAKVGAPPPGWSVAAKSEFDGLPESVKSAIAKREEEIDRGFARLKDFKALETQHGPAAQQYGVPLGEYINRLASADRFLQSDPVNAIKWLSQAYGVDLRALGGPPAQQVQPQSEALEPLLRELNGLKQIVYGDKQSQIANQVDQFFADPKNKYSENVADQMVVLINEAKRTGQPVDLPSIYETACFMNPEVRTALINEQQSKIRAEQAEKAKRTADQARAAGASITGGPATTPPPVDPNLSLRETLERQFAPTRT